MRPSQTPKWAPPPAAPPQPTGRPMAGPTRRPHARGFTLIEAAMVMVIVGVGVLSMLQLLAAGSVQNADAAELTTAMTLTNSVREMSMGLAFYDPNQDPAVAPRFWNSKEATIAGYDNITDLDGTEDTWNDPEKSAGWQKFSPPLDGNRQTIAGHKTWAQYVKVETVDPARIRTVLPQDPNAEVARVTVKVTRNEVEIYRTSWLVCVPLTATKP